MQHKTTIQAGTHANNHVGRCSCGYAFSSTWQAVHNRLRVHEEVFENEHRMWGDPGRKTDMPAASV